jgi:phage gpG-like protein
MITLTVSVSGFGLDDLDSHLADFSGPISEILEQALMDAEHTVRVTKDEWPPMAASTIKSGRDPSSLLVKSGELADSLARGGPGNIFEAGSHSGIAGSAVEHAGFQHFGFDGHPFRPPRPFLVWAEERIGPGPELEGPYAEILLRHLFGKR